MRIRAGYYMTRLIAECHDQSMRNQNCPGCFLLKKKWQNPYGDGKAGKMIVGICRDAASV
jgi:UDP-N-acetylglucosamine 2-epimerase